MDDFEITVEILIGVELESDNMFTRSRLINAGWSYQGQSAPGSLNECDWCWEKK